MRACTHEASARDAPNTRESKSFINADHALRETASEDFTNPINADSTSPTNADRAPEQMSRREMKRDESHTMGWHVYKTTAPRLIAPLHATDVPKMRKQSKLYAAASIATVNSDREFRVAPN